MSIALAPALSPSATPNPSRAERLHDLLNRFAVEARAEGTLLGDAQGFLVAGSDRFDGAEGEAWAAATVEALTTAAAVQRITGYRVSPEASVKLGADQRLFATFLPRRGADEGLTVGVLGTHAPDRKALKALAEAVREVLDGPRSS